MQKSAPCASMGSKLRATQKATDGDGGGEQGCRGDAGVGFFQASTTQMQRLGREMNCTVWPFGALQLEK